MNRERILIFRPDNIGDVVLFSGALRHIRTLFPDAHLTLAVQPHILNLVELCPYVDSCVPVTLLTWRERFVNSNIPYAYRFGTIKRIISAMNRAWNSSRLTFDTILYPVKSPLVEHLQIVHDLNVRKIIGITGCTLNEPPEGYPADLQPAALFTDQIDVSAADPWRHELLTTCDFLRYLGYRVSALDDIQPEFWLADTETDHLAEMRKDGIDIIGLFPGTTSEVRCWGERNFGDFVRSLGGNYCYAIFGGPADKGLAARVASSIRATGEGATIINLAGETTLRELVRSISSCDLFISMDTSALHMAISVGVPTVGIIGGGHYGRFVPWGNDAKNIFLTKELECFHCNWLCIKERVECIQGVAPLEVAKAAKKLLKG